MLPIYMMYHPKEKAGVGFTSGMNICRVKFHLNLRTANMTSGALEGDRYSLVNSFEHGWEIPPLKLDEPTVVSPTRSLQARMIEKC